MGFAGTVWGKIDEVESVTNERLDHTANTLLGRVGTFESQQLQAQHETECQFRELRAETDRRLKWMEQEANSLRLTVNEVESIPTRRVEWLVQGASAQLLGPKQQGGGTGDPSDCTGSWF